MKFMISLSLIFLCSFLHAESKQKKTYKIKLSPVRHVGDTYFIKCSVVNKKTKIIRMLASTQEYKKTHILSIYLRGKVKILAVNKNNIVTKKQITVSFFKVTLNDKPINLSVKPKMVITSTREKGKQHFSFAQKLSLEKLEAVALKLTFSLASQDVTTDEIAGTSKEKAIGERWRVNKKLILKEYNKQHLNIDAKNITGASKLASTYKINKKRYLKVVSAFILKNPKLKLPKNLSLLNSKMVVTTTYNFPADLSTPSILTEINKKTITNTKSGKTKKSPALVYSIIDNLNIITHFKYE